MLRGHITVCGHKAQNIFKNTVPPSNEGPFYQWLRM